MKKIYTSLFIMSCSISLFAQISPAVATNMRFAYEEIKDLFTEMTGYNVTPVYGSSGKLVAQIRSGAPFDLFVSADIGFADSVVCSNLNATTPKVFAYGKLVLWTLKPLDLSKGLSILTDNEIKTVAVGDLKLTVYGSATKQVLSRSTLWSTIVPKVVYGESITKVAQFIESGSADIGFTAKSHVLATAMKEKGTWIDIDSSLYDPLPQAALILQHGKKYNEIAVQELHNFIFSKEAHEILIKYGYTIP